MHKPRRTFQKRTKVAAYSLAGIIGALVVLLLLAGCLSTEHQVILNEQTQKIKALSTQLKDIYQNYQDGVLSAEEALPQIVQLSRELADAITKIAGIQSGDSGGYGFWEWLGGLAITLVGGYTGIRFWRGSPKNRKGYAPDETVTVRMPTPPKPPTPIPPVGPLK